MPTDKILNPALTLMFDPLCGNAQPRDSYEGAIQTVATATTPSGIDVLQGVSFKIRKLKVHQWHALRYGMIVTSGIGTTNFAPHERA